MRAVPGAEGKFLRLIMQGKLLSPDTAPLTTFKVFDRAVVHCVVSDRAPQPHIGACMRACVSSSPGHGGGVRK